jgi:glutathione S-transferase
MILIYPLQGFPIVEGMVVKPRVKALDEGVLSDAEIREQIKDGVVELQRYLAVAESLMAPEAFAFGDHPTWADFFLFPILADLRMVPEWELVSDRLKRWIKLMDTLPAVEATKAGTLSVGARPT